MRSQTIKKKPAGAREKPLITAGSLFRCPVCDEVYTRGVWRRYKRTLFKVCRKDGKGLKAK